MLKLMFSKMSKFRLTYYKNIDLFLMGYFILSQPVCRGGGNNIIMLRLKIKKTKR